MASCRHRDRSREQEQLWDPRAISKPKRLRGFSQYPADHRAAHCGHAPRRRGSVQRWENRHRQQNRRPPRSDPQSCVRTSWTSRPANRPAASRRLRIQRRTFHRPSERCTAGTRRSARRRRPPLNRRHRAPPETHLPRSMPGDVERLRIAGPGCKFDIALTTAAQRQSALSDQESRPLRHRLSSPAERCRLGRGDPRIAGPRSDWERQCMSDHRRPVEHSRRFVR